jgi:hypothetical protein
MHKVKDLRIPTEQSWKPVKIWNDVFIDCSGSVPGRCSNAPAKLHRPTLNFLFYFSINI